jgi:hypothetical protein
MEVKDITRKRLSSGGTAEEERDLSVSLGMLGEVIIDAEGVPSRVPEIFSHGTSAVGRDVLQGGWV